MSVRFTTGRGNNRNTFDRAPQHTKRWDDQKMGFRMSLGFPAHGHTAR